MDFRILLALLAQGVIGDVFQPLLGFFQLGLRYIAARHGVHEKGIRAGKDRIHLMVLVLAEIDDGRVPGQQAAGGGRVRGGRIFQVVAQEDALVGRIEHLGIVEQVGRPVVLVVIDFIGPGVIIRVEHEHVVVVVKDLVLAVIPAAVGPQETLVPPGVGVLSEVGFLLFGEIAERLGLDLDRVHIDFHALFEGEESFLAVIGPSAALDDIAVLVLECAAVLEDGHAVLGVVYQFRGAQRVAVLVEEFHQRAAELRLAVIDPVEHLLALEHRVVLDDLHVAVGLDELGVHVPGSGVTQQIGVVVQEAGVPLDQAVVQAVFLILLGPFGLDQTEDAFLGRILCPGKTAAG